MPRPAVSSRDDSRASSPLSAPPSDSSSPAETTSIKATRKRKATVSVTTEPTADLNSLTTTTTATKIDTTSTTVTKKRRTAKPSTPSMHAARSTTTKLLLGAHVSMAKGVQNSIPNATSIGANAFALFLKSQRKWTSPPLPAADITAFAAACKEQGYDPKKQILPHASYLVNLAQPDPAKATQARDNFLDDIRRCEALGIGMHNFHPGSTLGEPRPAALARIAENLNTIHKQTEFCKTVIENMAGAGNVIGCDFEDIRDIIKDVEDKSRVGVCLDTCHLFAAGHDIRTKESYDQVMANFDRIVGREYLCAWHINDSKAPLGSKRDLHANIGEGWIGLDGFRVLVNDESIQGMLMVLETPTGEDPGVWAKEIKMLEGLVGEDGTGEDFSRMCAELQKNGKGEREKFGNQAEKRKAAPAKKGGKKVKAEEEEEEEGCGSCAEKEEDDDDVKPAKKARVVKAAKAVKEKVEKVAKTAKAVKVKKEVKEEKVEAVARSRPSRARAQKSLKEESSEGEE